MKTIDLSNYRPPNSFSFSGRPQGELVRKELQLEKIEKEVSEIHLTIPSDTTSFNPSFFLGLLFESIKKLGVEKFRQIYHIDITTKDPILNGAINRNIEDGFRNAVNSLNNKTSYSY